MKIDSEGCEYNAIPDMTEEELDAITAMVGEFSLPRAHSYSCTEKCPGRKNAPSNEWPKNDVCLP
jgi:hypothetical protein